MAAREKEHRHNEFMAALKGIDINKGKETDAKEKFDEIQSRVTSKLTGESQEKLEIGNLGFEFEVED